MRIIATISILTLCASSFAQEIWHQLPIVENYRAIIHDVTSKGEILASTNYPNQLLLSSDLGETWNLVTENLLQDSGKLIVEEDSKGNLLIAYDSTDKLYMLNQTRDTFSLLKEFSPVNFGNILSKENGTTLISFINGISVFDADFELVEMLDLPYSNYQIAEKNSDTTIIFDIDNSRMASFEELSDISAWQPIPSSNNYYYVGGRYYSNSSFSDNGVDWQDYNTPQSDLYLVDSKGNIIIKTFSEYWHSSDRGENFKNDTINPFLRGTEIYEYLDSGYILSERSNCFFDFQMMFIDSSFQTSHILNDEIGAPKAGFIESGIGQLYMNDCSNRHTYQCISESWVTESANVVVGSTFPIVQSKFLPNNRLISKSLYTSDDLGQTWLPPDSSAGFLEVFTIKNDIFYGVGNNSLIYSEDSGDTFKIESHSLSSPQNIYEVNSKGRIIYRQAPNVDIQILDYISDEKSWLDRTTSPNSISNVTSSYNGDCIYYIVYLGLNLYEFRYTCDYGKTHNSYPLPDFFTRYNRSDIHIDENEKVFLVSEEFLWESDNQGETWLDITPVQVDSTMAIGSLSIGYDGIKYLSVAGLGILSTKVKESTSSLDESNVKNNILYPNPTSSNINVKNIPFEKYISTLFHISGVKMITSEYDVIDCSSLESGIYFLRIDDLKSEEYIVEKLIIN